MVVSQLVSQCGSQEVDPSAGIRRQDLNSKNAFNAELT